MKLLSVNHQTKTAQVEWRGKVRELKIRYGHDETVFNVPIAGKVGRTGQKLWVGHQTFWLTDGEWKPGSAYGGINMRVFTPVCFVDEVPEEMACKR